MASPRILIVEDEWLIAEDLSAQVASAGYEVVGPASGVAKALSLIEEQAIDAAILDIRLDHEDSGPVAQALAERGIPFATISGYGSSDVPEGCSRRSASLSKPVSNPLLLSTLARLTSE